MNITHLIEQILASFAELQLKQICIVNLEGQDWHHLINFLRNQRQLCTLSIYDAGRIPRNLQLETLKEQLAVESFNIIRAKCEDMEKFVEFIELFADCARNICIKKLEKTADSHLVFNAILQNFKHLHSMSIPFDQLPANRESYQDLEVNQEMESLVINSKHLDNPIGLRGIVETYPSVRNFSATFSTIGGEVGADDFQYLFDTWKNLEKFSLLLKTVDILNQGYLRNITTLHIMLYSAAVNWTAIASKSPKLSTLIIDLIPTRNQLNLESILLNLKHLTLLELGNGFHMTQRELSIIQEKEIELRELRILRSEWKINQAPEEIFLKLKLGLVITLIS